MFVRLLVMFASVFDGNTGNLVEAFDKEIVFRNEYCKEFDFNKNLETYFCETVVIF